MTAYSLAPIIFTVQEVHGNEKGWLVTVWESDAKGRTKSMVNHWDKLKATEEEARTLGTELIKQ